jgi:hypothetical protein
LAAIELPGAWHVLHDNARIAGQMFADVARHHATVGIESPAGSGADEHHDGFASEELLGRGWTTAIRTNAAEKMTFTQRQTAKPIERP